MHIAQALHFGAALLPSGWETGVRLRVRDGLLEAIETGVPACAGDERHGCAIPGLPNLHSHAFQRGMAGMAERRGPSDDSFWTWRETMYRFVDRLRPDDVEAIASLAYMEMLETGFTRVGEFHYLHHDLDGGSFANPAEMAEALAGAASGTGIALTLLPVFYAHSGFGGAEPGHGQRRFVCNLDFFGRLLEGCGAALAGLPDAVLGIAPHSLRAVTPDELSVLLGMRPEGPVHIHIAEQVREVEDCIAWSGKRPVEWLLDKTPVDPRWCLVHATHMREDEIVRLAGSGAIAGLCPVTEANLGDGLFPAEAFARAGGLYGIGTDSNVLIDASEELRWLEYGQRLLHRGRNLLSGDREPHTGAAVYRAALAGGSGALGAVHGFIPGAAADILSLDLDAASMMNREKDACIDSWIFAAGRSAVDCVWRRGERLVSKGQHRARPAIVARCRAVMQRLM
jgi:formimidoylglutamate deiminase